MRGGHARSLNTDSTGTPSGALPRPVVVWRVSLHGCGPRKPSSQGATPAGPSRSLGLPAETQHARGAPGRVNVRGRACPACACRLPTPAGQGCGERVAVLHRPRAPGGQRLSCLSARGNLMRGSCVRAGPGRACMGVRAVGRLWAPRAPHRRRPRRAIEGDQRVDET